MLICEVVKLLMERETSRHLGLARDQHQALQKEWCLEGALLGPPGPGQQAACLLGQIPTKHVMV